MLSQCCMKLNSEEVLKGLPSSMFWRVIPLTKNVRHALHPVSHAVWPNSCRTIYTNPCLPRPHMHVQRACLPGEQG